jgi:hypothetical protein
MQIPFNHFEQYVNETILKRGLSYFKKGYVHQPEELTPHEYEAIVNGSEDYTVHLTIKNETITKYTCTCPYDDGPICKHVVAVIFYLQQDELKLNEKTKRAATGPKATKGKSVARQVEELIEKADPGELKQFLREQASADSAFRNLLLAKFAHHNSDESKELYVKQLKAIYKSAYDRYGYINTQAAKTVSIAVDNLLETAQKQISNNNTSSAALICIAVMEQLIQVLQNSDDSYGNLRTSIDTAFELLYDIAQEPLSEEIRELIIDYCFTSFDKQIYVGWDWHTGVLDIASLLLKTEDEIQRIFKQIDNLQKSEYDKERAQTIKYDILLRTRGEVAAEQYLEQNIANPGLRRQAIQNALENKNYEKAIALAQDGVNNDLIQKPGLAKNWYNWLLKIAQAQNNKDKIIEYARLLLIENIKNEQDYYKVLKQQIEPENWTTFI